MKKTNFLYASLFVAACSVGMMSCSASLEDNPAPQPEPGPVFVEEIFTYDFAAVAEAEQNPAKFNGNQKDGQAFPCWWDASDPDRDRNNYKGYKWEEGSLLPEVCHVFPFNSQINNNVKKEKGGLVITQANCPIAIDGIQAGSKVQIFYTASKEVEVDVTADLKDVPFYNCEGTFGKDAKKENTANCAWVVNESTGQPYGDGSVNNFADLSAYEKLIVVATDGQPRFCFNRDEAEGQQDPENEEGSHLIDYPNKGGWSAKYFSSETTENGTVWTVDLAQMVKDKGYAHLHAIKGANWANCTVTSMTLVGKKKETVPTEDKLIWAVGDGSKCNNGNGPLSTAVIDGVEAVIGQTKIASGAIIEVKTAAPYFIEGERNSSPHIVVTANKNIVITKVVITNYIEQKDEE
jgi:hypothetical protein